MAKQNHGRGENAHSDRVIQTALSELLTVAATPEDDSCKARWESFYALWKEPATRIAANTGVPRSQREDLIQEVSLKMMARWGEFRRPGGARELLALSHKMMHDAAVDLVRSLGRQRGESLDGVAAKAIDPKADDPARVAAAKEINEEVRAGLERLEAVHPKYAWVLSERFLKERPIKELAAEKGMNEHMVRCLETRALRAMRCLISGGDDGVWPMP